MGRLSILIVCIYAVFICAGCSFTGQSGLIDYEPPSASDLTAKPLFPSSAEKAEVEELKQQEQAEEAAEPKKGGITTISLVGVNREADTCGIKVNGETAWIKEGSNDVVQNIRIHVFEADLLHADGEDGICEILIAGQVLSLNT